MVNQIKISSIWNQISSKSRTFLVKIDKHCRKNRIRSSFKILCLIKLFNFCICAAQIEKFARITINLFVLQLRHAKTDTKNVYRKFLKTWFFCGGSFAAKVRKNTQKVVSYRVSHIETCLLNWLTDKGQLIL